MIRTQDECWAIFFRAQDEAPKPRSPEGPGQASFGQLPDELCPGLAESLLESLKASARFCEDGTGGAV